jgi:hypothetical protein
MRTFLIDLALFLGMAAIIAPGLVWWLQTIAAFVWGPLP